MACLTHQAAGGVIGEVGRSASPALCASGFAGTARAESMVSYAIAFNPLCLTIV